MFLSPQILVRTQPKLSGFTATSAESAAFLARTSGMDTAHKTAVDAFITGLVTDSLWSLCDAQYLLCQDTAGNAALNLKSSSFTLTVNGSPTFTADSGYVGGTTANLDTGFNASTAGGNLTQNSSSAFIWTLTNLTASVDYGAALGQNTVFDIDLYPHAGTNVFFPHMTSTSGTPTITQTGHFYGASRTSSAGSTGYVDTTAGTAGSDTSTALTSTNVILLNDGAGAGSNSRPFTANLAYAWLGAGLNSTQQGNLYARVHTYMQTIAGAP